MNFDVQSLNNPEMYHLLVGGVLPRPIAWISSKSESGIINLAPYSFFTVASVKPPVLSVTQVNAQNGIEKDTVRNLRKTGECVVNTVSTAQLEVMNQSCADYPPDASEFEKAGIEQCPSLTVAVPGVKDAKVRYECKLREIITMGSTPGAGVMMLLDVLSVYVADDAYNNNNGHIRPDAADLLGKMGGNEYTHTRDCITLNRPTL